MQPDARRLLLAKHCYWDSCKLPAANSGFQLRPVGQLVAPACEHSMPRARRNVRRPERFRRDIEENVKAGHTKRKPVPKQAPNVETPEREQEAPKTEDELGSVIDGLGGLQLNTKAHQAQGTGFVYEDRLQLHQV